MSYNSVVLATSGLLNYWRLGESSGTVAADAGPGAATGTYGATVTLAQASLLASDADTSVHLPGTTATTSSDIINAATYTPPTTPFWVECLVNVDASPPAQHQPIISIMNAGDTQRISVMARRNAAGNFLTVWSTSSSWLDSATSLTPGTTYHIVVQISSTAATYYVNGSQVSSISGTLTATGFDRYAIGGSQSGASDRLKGFIDEVSVGQGTIGQSNVTAHYNATLVAASSGSASGGVNFPTSFLVNQS